jgi:hypothetical protein
MTILTGIFEDEQFIAGEYVSTGTYQQAGTSRTIHFTTPSYLPGSPDGRMCSYFRIEDTEPTANHGSHFRANELAASVK